MRKSHGNLTLCAMRIAGSVQSGTCLEWVVLGQEPFPWTSIPALLKMLSTFSISLYPMRNWKKLRAAQPARIAILAPASRQSVSQIPHFLRSSALKLLSRDEARRIVSKIVKLPRLLREAVALSTPIAPSISFAVRHLVVRTVSAVPANPAHGGQTMLECCEPAIRNSGPIL
jgi:hypothetical protein